MVFLAATNFQGPRLVDTIRILQVSDWL